MRWLPVTFGDDSLVTDDEGEPDIPEFDDGQLLEWAMGGNYQMLVIQNDATGVVVTASVIWPDGSTGTYTTLVKSVGCNAIDSYQITHNNSGATVTQPTVTRDGFCMLTNQPQIVVSGYTITSPASSTVELGTIVDIATVAQVQASIVTANFISLLADDNGTPGVFVRDTSSSATHDGVTTLVDANGTRFTRRTHT